MHATLTMMTIERLQIKLKIESKNDVEGAPLNDITQFDAIARMRMCLCVCIW